MKERRRRARRAAFRETGGRPSSTGASVFEEVVPASRNASRGLQSRYLLAFLRQERSVPSVSEEGEAGAVRGERDRGDPSLLLEDADWRRGRRARDWGCRRFCLRPVLLTPVSGGWA